jgi:hypothetical protein
MITKTKKAQPDYFIGGATWKGENVYSEFIEKGIWRSGWGSKQDHYRPILEQIKKGNRIAIKKGMGPNDPRIQIRAIGIVKSVDLDEEYCTVYVDWIRIGMRRMVDSHGCYKTVHGPYQNSQPSKVEISDWINKIFCL